MLLAGSFVALQRPGGVAVFLTFQRVRHCDKPNLAMAQIVQMLHGIGHAFFNIDVHVTEAGIVRAAANHHKGQVLLFQQLHPPVVQQNLHQNHAVGLTAAKNRQQVVIAEGFNNQVERVIGLFAAKRGGGDNALRGRVEILRKMQGNEQAFARAKLLPGDLRRKAPFIHQLQHPLASLFGHIRLVVDDARHGGD